MLVGIDISQAQYPGTGVGTYTTNLVKHLVALDTAHQFILFGSSLRNLKSLRQFTSSLNSNRVKTRLYPSPTTFTEYIFNTWRRLPIETFTGRLDVFHSSDWTQPPVASAKTVTTIHDLTTIKFPEHQHPQIIATHARRHQLITKEVDHVITDSKATQTDVLNHLNINKSQTTVIHLAASDDFLAFAKLPRLQKHESIVATRRKYHLPANYILSVGTNEPRKNLDRLIKAYSQLTSQIHNPPELVIAGRFGWGSSNLKTSDFKHLPIRLLGFVDQPSLPALYAGAQSFVYASIYEGFGLPVLEAMTLGIPVVTTDRGSLKEVAGSAAVLVNPFSTKSITDGLGESLLNKNQLRKQSLKQAKNFSWDKTAQQTLAVYEHLSQK